MEGTKGEVIICQNIQRQNCLLRKKKKDEQTNSLVFLPQVPKLLQLLHTHSLARERSSTWNRVKTKSSRSNDFRQMGQFHYYLNLFLNTLYMNENECFHKQVMKELERVGLGYGTPCSALSTPELASALGPESLHPSVSRKGDRVL